MSASSTSSAPSSSAQAETHSGSNVPGSDIRLNWLGDLTNDHAPPMDWLWEGYLAPGKITLLTSLAKSGKTTLVSVLLDKMRSGGALAGRPVRAGRAVIVSEEDLQLWRERCVRLPLANNVCLISQPFLGKATFEQWLVLIDRLLALHAQHGIDLVVIDALANFLPTRTENDAVSMMAALAPLRRLTALGISVLLLHHPRKEASTEGHAARGSSALTGFVDILLEMRPLAGATGEQPNRCRRLLGYSRHAQTPPHLILEWNADGTDYLLRTDEEGDPFADSWLILRMVLEDASSKLTRLEILADWPADFIKPPSLTLWRWLDRGVHKGLILQEGTGRKRSPFRYWLPGHEEKWALDPWGVFEK
jgi:hypothetical protein